MKYKETRLNDTPYPTVFYVGMGKTGSASLFFGVKNKSIAHWHNTEYFCRIHNDYELIKSGYTIYDYIAELGIKHDFKPIIIECFRDPVAQRLSWYFQVFKGITAKQAIHAIQSDLWHYTPNLDIEQPHQEYDFEVIYLKLEEIDTWEHQLRLDGIEWEPTHQNKRKDYEYYKAVDTLKLSREKLEQIYFSNNTTEIYTFEEIEKFIERWKY